jgi:hypothetical protein
LRLVIDGLMNGYPQKAQGACNKAHDGECLDEIASSEAPEKKQRKGTQEEVQAFSHM